MDITTVGLDLAKNVFQVHAINSAGEVVVKKTLRRVQMRRFFEQLDPCLVGIEACGTSHYWAREITQLGHEVRLMPPSYVKPYVKRGKTDAGDAEGDLRGGETSHDAVCRDQIAQSAGGAGATPHAGSVRQTAYPAGQHDPRPAGGVRH